MSVCIHEHEAVVAERDALRREVDRLKSEGDKLDAPAMVGNARFGKGVHWRSVIMAAQRRYHETVTLESESARLEKVAATNVIVSLRDAEIARLNKEISASQFREMQLRDEMVRIGNWLINKDYCITGGEVIRMASEEKDTTALQSMITKAGEVMRERAVVASGNVYSVVEIRAIPAITLDDLKGGA